MGESKLNLEALVAALENERKQRKLSWRALAREAGVSPSTLTRMQQGKLPDVDTFARLVHWLGVSADDFLAGGKPTGRSKPHPVTAASVHLRSQKELSPKAAKALDELMRAAYRFGRDV